MSLENLDTADKFNSTEKPTDTSEESQKESLPKPATTQPEPEDFRGKPNDPNSARWF